MHKYKVVVYAIAKNEEKFVKRWYKSMSEADEIYVLDTGSTDNTIKLLKELGVKVEQKEIRPWRFDTARNESLKLVPHDADICVCTDLDEVFNTGWRDYLEESWNNANHLRYHYNWKLDESNKPIISFTYNKIHDRKNYTWTHPVHETLFFTGNNEITKEDYRIVLNHYPDDSKSRSSYLPLLELAYQENPLDDRNLFYLGREYMMYERYNDCIDILNKHLNLESSKWIYERSASMRYIGRSYDKLDRLKEAEYWYDLAIKECQYIREPYVEMALFQFNRKRDYIETINNCIKAKSILEKNNDYINEYFSWDSTIDDLLSVSYYNLGLKDEALFYVNKALDKNPNNERIRKNKEIFEQS